MERVPENLPVVNMHDAKTNLSRLVEQAALGQPFLIARAGKPIVKVTAVDASPPREKRRFGFLAGQITVPEDFDTMYEEEIVRLFQGGDE